MTIELRYNKFLLNILRNLNMSIIAQIFLLTIRFVSIDASASRSIRAKLENGKAKVKWCWERWSDSLNFRCISTDKSSMGTTGVGCKRKDMRLLHDFFRTPTTRHTSQSETNKSTLVPRKVESTIQDLCWVSRSWHKWRKNRRKNCIERTS